MLFIEFFLLLSLFVSSKCDPETLLIETEGESESENNNNDEDTLPLSNPNLNEDGEENEEDATESHDAGDSVVGFCLILNKTLMQVNRTSSIKQPGVFCGRRCPGNGGERDRGRQWKGTI